MSYQPQPFEEDLAAWLERASGVAVIYSRQSAPRPPLSYITLGQARLSSTGTPDRRVVDQVVGADLYRGQRRHTYAGTVDVNVYGANHQQIALAVEQSVWDSAEIAAAADRTKVEQVNALNGAAVALGPEWEGRSLLEVAFAYTAVIEYDAEAVETVAATPEVA